MDACPGDPPGAPEQWAANFQHPDCAKGTPFEGSGEPFRPTPSLLRTSASPSPGFLVQKLLPESLAVTGRRHSNRLHPSGGAGHHGGRPAEEPSSRAVNVCLWAFEEERLCVHQPGPFRPGGLCFCPSAGYQQAPLGFSRKAAVPSREASRSCVICVVCECVHARGGRPSLGSPSKFHCQQETPGCAHGSVPIWRERLWAPGIPPGTFCARTSALGYPARREEGEACPARAPDGAEVQTGALPVHGGEKPSNLKIMFARPNGTLIKM